MWRESSNQRSALRPKLRIRGKRVRVSLSSWSCFRSRGCNRGTPPPPWELLLHCHTSSPLAGWPTRRLRPVAMPNRSLNGPKKTLVYTSSWVLPVFSSACSPNYGVLTGPRLYFSPFPSRSSGVRWKSTANGLRRRRKIVAKRRDRRVPRGATSESPYKLSGNRLIPSATSALHTASAPGR